MRKTFKFFMCAAIMAVGFVGCSSEDVNPTPDPNGGGDVTVEEGKPTFATFSFNVLNGPESKASMVDDTNEPANVNSIRLLIFKTGNSTVCETNTAYKSGDTNWDNTKSATVKLTSGTKKIFVIANAEEQTNIKAALDAISVNTTTLAEFYSKIYELGGNSVSQFSITEISDKTNGLIMSNPVDITCQKTLASGITEDQSRTGSSDATNSFTFYIQRAVAKGKVSYNNATTLNTTDGMGKLTGLTYGIHNVNRSVYLFQQFATDNVDSYINDITKYVLPRAPYYNQMDGWSEADLKDKTKYLPYYYTAYDYEGNGSLTLYEKGNSSAKTVYFTENTNNVTRVGNSTFALISSTFLPGANKVVKSFDYDEVNKKFINVTYEPTAATTGKDLYKTTQAAEGLAQNSLFTDITLAYKAAYCIQHQINPSGTPPTPSNEEYIMKYTNGKCYYRLNIGKGNTADNSIEYGVKRNYNYQANITKFAGIGENDPSKLTDAPEQPLGMMTHVTAIISIVNWRDANSEVEL